MIGDFPKSWEEIIATGEANHISWRPILTTAAAFLAVLTLLCPAAHQLLYAQPL
jgi:hypothetical protein